MTPSAFYLACLSKLKKEDAMATSQRTCVVGLTYLLGLVFLCAAADVGAGPPYQRSTYITGVQFNWGTHRQFARGSDNWPITWADDDNQYASWGDGGGFGGSNSDGRVSLGFARITGGEADYQGKNVWGGKGAENPAQFSGKSYGIVSIGGVLYMWRGPD